MQWQSHEWPYTQWAPPGRTGKQRGGNGGPWRPREESAEEQAEEQGRAVNALLSETRTTYPSGNLLAATDFFTLHVPLSMQQGAGAGQGMGPAGA